MLFKKQTEIIEVDPEDINQAAIDKAALVLEKGGLVVYPTDTAYGLGVNAYDEKAVAKLYDIKLRDPEKPTHVVVRDWQMIGGTTITNKEAKAIHDKFMPGPITIVLLKKEGIYPENLTGGLPTIGVRIPNNKITQALSLAVSFPYTTPSANKAGANTPYSVTQVAEELGLSGIDLVLDAGPMPEKFPSVIVNLSNPENIRIIREGDIKQQQIMAVLKSVYAPKAIY